MVYNLNYTMESDDFLGIKADISLMQVYYGTYHMVPIKTPKRLDKIENHGA
jgi:hypothetical protein